MEKKLFFTNSEGNKLCGILTDPSGDRSKLLVVLCHGFNSSKNSGTCKSIAKKLREKNISTFRFDFFAHGESIGNFEDLTVSKAIDDTLSAIEFMKNMGFTKIGLFGSSFGGLSSYFVASKSDDLQFLIQKAPVANYKDIEDFNSSASVSEWKKTGYRKLEGKKLKYAFYEDAIKNNAYEIAEDITIPTLIIHGNTDRDVPVTQSINIAKRIQNCALEIVVGADHRFTIKKDFKRFLDSVLAFVTAHSAG